MADLKRSSWRSHFVPTGIINQRTSNFCVEDAASGKNILINVVQVAGDGHYYFIRLFFVYYFKHFTTHSNALLLSFSS